MIQSTDAFARARASVRSSHEVCSAGAPVPLGDVPAVQAHEHDGSDLEGVPAPAGFRCPVRRQRVAGHVGHWPGPAGQAGHRHPRAAGRRELAPVGEAAPGGGRAAQAAVHQVEQRLEGLHRARRVAGQRVGGVRVVRDGQVTEAREPERRAVRRRGAEGRRERVPGVGVVVGGHRVGVGRAGPQPRYRRVIGPDDLAGGLVGISLLPGEDHPLPDPDARPRRAGRGSPRDHHARGRVVAPRQVNLLGSAVAQGGLPSGGAGLPSRGAGLPSRST